MDLQGRLSTVDWSDCETAYGPADNVPLLLQDLASDDVNVAKKASHDLWCGLCHQHAFTSSAALPSYPFMLEVLLRAKPILQLEVLDILVGLAICTNESRCARRQDWPKVLRQQMKNDLDVFRNFAGSRDEDIADFASRVVEELESG